MHFVSESERDGMPRRRTLARLGSAGSGLVGFVHLLVPELLLSIAARGYRLVLAVEFEPSERAPRRVQLIGVGFVAIGVALGLLSTALPGGDGSGA